MKTAIIYSFNTNKTAKAGEKIAEVFGDAMSMQKVNAEDISKDNFLNYDFMILGVPTWFDGELPNYWDEFVPALEEMDLKGKIIAIYGLADQVGYPENFADGVGIMAKILRERGAKIIGSTSSEGYNFESSLALENGKFLGLILDQENQARMTKKRIEIWVSELKSILKK